MTSAKQKIAEAACAASETQPSWGWRVFRILSALGLDYGDPEDIDWLIKKEVLDEFVYKLEREYTRHDVAEDYKEGIKFATLMLQDATKLNREVKL